MISLSHAQNIIRDHKVKSGEINLPVTGALGRICAEDMIARMTQPPFAASAMDGYAVRFSDMTVGAQLKVIGEAPAGTPYEGTINSGEALRLFTGSVIPGGADHVIIQEDVAREGDKILVNAFQNAPRNIRQAGIDFKEGDVLVEVGTQLTPPDIALLAAGNHAQVTVRKKVKVALLACGDELRPPGSDLTPGQIISSNQAALGALFESWRMEVIDLGTAADDPADISRRVEDAQEADVIVPIGGASVGDYDHMRSTFAALGYETLFEKVAVRPGKPTWFAKKGEQRVLGLPGNPASAYVCAHIFARVLFGLPEAKPLYLPTTLPIGANGRRDHFLRARIALGDDNALTVMPSPKKDSSLIMPLAWSNAFVHLAAGEAAHEIGDSVKVIPLRLQGDLFN